MTLSFRGFAMFRDELFMISAWHGRCVGNAGMNAADNRLLFRVEHLDRFEARLAALVPVHAHVLSACKLAVTAALALALNHSAVASVAWFLLFALLDYLDGVVARGRGQASAFGRVWDRITDAPMLLMLGAFCVDLVPLWLVVLKLGVDVLFLVLFIRGHGSTENRVRTIFSYSMLLSLLALSLGWPIPVELVYGLFAVGITFSVLVAAYNTRRVADLLSFANLLCGLAIMAFAAMGLLHLSIACLIGSVIFDGLDGAAARRWGGSRFGVLADDIADGLSYGIAPGYAIAVTLPGTSGTIVGVGYALFVGSRLVFFTLNKAENDPQHFRGAPSTLGAVVVLCALQLFTRDPLTVGMFVGAAIVAMVSFDVRYRHLGRALAQERWRLWLALPIAAVFGLGAWLAGINGAVIVLLVLTVGYGVRPTVNLLVQRLRWTRSNDDEAPVPPRDPSRPS